MALPAPPPPPPPATRVTGLSWDKGTLTVSAEGPLTLRYFTLASPDRLVLDLSHATLARPGLARTWAIASPPVRDARMAYHPEADTVRVVLDLAKPTAFTVSRDVQADAVQVTEATVASIPPLPPGLVLTTGTIGLPEARTASPSVQAAPLPLGIGTYNPAGFALSVVVPGGGQIYSGDWLTGALLLGTSVAAYSMAIAGSQQGNVPLLLGGTGLLVSAAVASPLDYWWTWHHSGASPARQGDSP